MILTALRFLLIAGLLGAVIGFAMPPTALPWVIMLPVIGALLAMLWSFGGRRAAWKGFGFGYIAGAASFAVELAWLSVVSPIGAIVLPLYLGLFWGVFGAFAATLGNPFRKPSGISRLGLVFANAAVWAFLEWLRGWLFTGFGWNGLGIVFHDTPLVAQSADLLGIAGISLLVIWTTGLAVTGISRADDGKKSFAKNHGIALLVTLLLVPAYGALRIHTEKSRETLPLRALLVQNNIPQDAAQYLWDPVEIHIAYEDRTLAALEKAKAAGTFPDWVIWPESALTGRFLRTSDGAWGTWRENSETLANVREGGDFTLMFGAVELEASVEGDSLAPKPDGATWNSLVALSPADELQTFRKHHLVIFGETIPFVDSIPWLKEIYKQQAGVEYGGSFAPGKSFEPLVAATATGKSIGIIPTVCFEDTVPRLTRRFLKPGPQVIVNVTNDGWFKQSPAAAQHFANARFRAIELRRPMLRAANTGVTAAVTTTGASQTLTGENGSPFISGTLLADVAVPVKPASTLYGIAGDWGIILAGAVGFLFAVKVSSASQRASSGETTV